MASKLEQQDAAVPKSLSPSMTNSRLVLISILAISIQHKEAVKAESVKKDSLHQHDNVDHIGNVLVSGNDLRCSRCDMKVSVQNFALAGKRPYQLRETLY